MARYETHADRIAQRKTMAHLVLEFGYFVTEKSAKYSVYDYDGLGEDTTYLIESKNRSNPSDAYTTTIIGVSKLDKMRVLAQKRGSSIIFAVTFTDRVGVFYIDPTKRLNYSTGYFKPEDRDGPPTLHYKIPVRNAIWLPLMPDDQAARQVRLLSRISERNRRREAPPRQPRRGSKGHPEGSKFRTPPPRYLPMLGGLSMPLRGRTRKHRLISSS